MTPRKKWMSFEKARSIVRGLGLKSHRDWVRYCASGEKYELIPSNPDKNYKNSGWISMGDWLGARVSRRKYDINHDYFKTWSSNMAYVLGLWFADGNIHHNVFTIVLHKDDSYLLQSILDDMSATYNVKFYDNMSSLTVTSPTFIEDVKKLGGKERKSWDVKFPLIPKQYMPDFMRGLWDGDGCITFNKGDNSYRSSIGSASKEFANGIRDCLNSVGIKSSIRTVLTKKGHVVVGNKLSRDSVFYVIDVGINGTRRLRDFMYVGDSDLKMFRKYNKFILSGEINLSYADRVYCDFEAARSFARSKGLQKRDDWFASYDKMGRCDIPKAPHMYYTEWSGWRDWLGPSLPRFLTFGEASVVVKSMNIKGCSQWNELCRRGLIPKNIPKRPYYVYKNEWLGWRYWLGLNSLSYNDFLLAVKTNGIKTRLEWSSFYVANKALGIYPRHPDRVYYGKGWTSWSDVLNKGF